MRCKWVVSYLTFLTVVMMFVGAVSAASPVATSPVSNYQNQVQIPDNIKTLDELVKYLRSKGIIKTDNDILDYMKSNKQVILKLSPNLIDYGFTYRLYAETNTPTRSDGLVKVTHDYGVKEVKIWVVPFSITNNSDQTLEISKENFALVPKSIPEGKELEVLAIEPEYIMDSAKGNVLGNFKLPPNNEVRLNAVFYVFPTTSEQNVNLRVYDGKDHTDVGIAKQ
ncbi:hypothetical protein NDK47_24040 [Brevibacillus ruminantium]|uniref:Uncharacterized protein n=1 Tax=Brevibacillus ruminantium TaxID=2950604 RepID=A0ABY4WDA2_9BACL|nr:hypothetical protein [Brevibacillus ruminantium]USG65157.1 hypothetical protein NDK47_24040 [Brevibacillus ruminantium]